MFRLVSVALPLAFLFLSASPILAQERSVEMEALEWMVGEWTYEPFPDGSGGTRVCEWFGNRFVKCEEAHVDGSGKQVASVLFVYKYDADHGVYKVSSFNSGGTDLAFSGTVQDDTWTWFGETPGGVKWRTFFLIESREAYIGKTEFFVDGEWVAHDEGRVTRIR